MASLADLLNQVPGSKVVVGLGHAHAGASKTISKQEDEQGGLLGSVSTTTLQPRISVHGKQI